MTTPGRGFSLIEAVVSMGIMGVALLAVGTLTHTIPLAQQTRYETLALAIAADKVGSVRGGGYGSVPSSGSFMSPDMATLPDGAGTLVVSDYNDKTKQVTVMVSWQKPGLAARSISLSTLITEVGGLP